MPVGRACAGGELVGAVAWRPAVLRDAHVLHVDGRAGLVGARAELVGAGFPRRGPYLAHRKRKGEGSVEWGVRGASGHSGAGLSRGRLRGRPAWSGRCSAVRRVAYPAHDRRVGPRWTAPPAEKEKGRTGRTEKGKGAPLTLSLEIISDATQPEVVQYLLGPPSPFIWAILFCFCRSELPGRLVSACSGAAARRCSTGKGTRRLAGAAGQTGKSPCLRRKRYSLRLRGFTR